MYWVSMILALTTLWLYYLWRTGMKERVGLQTMLLNDLLDTKAYEHHKEMTENFIKDQHFQTIEELENRLLYVTARHAREDLNIFVTRFHLALKKQLETQKSVTTSTE